MQLKHLDVVGAQAAQAAGDAALERDRTPVVAAGALVVAALGEEVDLAAPAAQRLADHGLGVAVTLGGIHDVEAGIDRVAQEAPDGGRVGALEADLGAAEAEHADLETGAAERAADHARPPGL